jgi:epoxide hydrolase-like predicted phosphatase
LITEEEHLRTVLEYYGQPGGNHKQLYTEFFSGDVLDEKLIDHVQSLKKTYKVGLLSNAWMNIRKNLSAWHGFVDVFDVSIFSSEVGLRKPDERIFRMILDRLGVEAQEAVFIDDFAENIAGADKLGIHTIQFRNREQAIAELSRLLEDQDPK